MRFGVLASLVTARHRQLAWSLLARISVFHRCPDCTSPSFQTRKLFDIQAQFQAPGRQTDPTNPRNVLDLLSPLPHAILPLFLTGPNCQLLSTVRDVMLNGNSAERNSTTVEEWARLKNVEEWVLLGPF